MTPTTKKRRRFQLRSLPYESIVLVISGYLMLCATFLPWLNDPWGMTYSAWNIPVDTGWQFHTSKFNYGILCVCCTCYTFFAAYAHLKHFKGARHFFLNRIFLGLICIIPLVFFFMQYLFSDLDSINLLAQHKIQMLLIQHHYGYGVATQPFLLQPFTLDISTLGGRVRLLLDQLSFGTLLPPISMGILIHRKQSAPSASSGKQLRSIWFASLFVILSVVILFGRALLGIAYEQQARIALANGDYLAAIGLLDQARFFNPSLDDIAFYHIERGQAKYFLHIDQLDDESRAYLASIYRGEKGTLDAYQQLLAVWQSYATPPSWIVDEVSITLEEQVEIVGPLRTSAPVLDVKQGALTSDTTALQWLQPLLQIDPNNLYGLYITAVIQYDLHSYTLSTPLLHKALFLSSDLDFQSSVYTFMALNAIKQGDYANGRALLLLAVASDPAYRNNAAREEMSGLR